MVFVTPSRLSRRFRPGDDVPPISQAGLESREVFIASNQGDTGLATGSCEQRVMHQRGVRVGSPALTSCESGEQLAPACEKASADGANTRFTRAKRCTTCCSSSSACLAAFATPARNSSENYGAALR